MFLLLSISRQVDTVQLCCCFSFDYPKWLHWYVTAQTNYRPSSLSMMTTKKVKLPRTLQSRSPFDLNTNTVRFNFTPTRTMCQRISGNSGHWPDYLMYRSVNQSALIALWRRSVMISTRAETRDYRSIRYENLEKTARIANCHRTRYLVAPSNSNNKIHDK